MSDHHQLQHFDNADGYVLHHRQAVLPWHLPAVAARALTEMRYAADQGTGMRRRRRSA